MNGECAADGGDARGNEARSRFAHLSQNGTEESAPLWHGPRLRAAFVAQVLGQIMGTQPPSQAQACSAYGSGRGVARLGFDSRA